jgi:hypothetical protein
LLPRHADLARQIGLPNLSFLADFRQSVQLPRPHSRIRLEYESCHKLFFETLLDHNVFRVKHHLVVQVIRAAKCRFRGEYKMQLAAYLKQKKLTYAAFGRLIDLPRVTIRQYALRQRVEISAVNLKKIVAATGGRVTANDFYGVETAKPKRRAA